MSTTYINIYLYNLEAIHFVVKYNFRSDIYLYNPYDLSLTQTIHN